MKKHSIVLVILIILATLAIVYAPRAQRQVTTGGGAASTTAPAGTAATTTLTGEFACLPHVGTGPSTMECAYGLKADDGSYYALDFSGTATSAFDLPMGRPYSVTGLLASAESLNSDHWKAYDIRGVMKVSSYMELTQGPAAVHTK